MAGVGGDLLQWRWIILEVQFIIKISGCPRRWTILGSGIGLVRLRVCDGGFHVCPVLL